MLNDKAAAVLRSERQASHALRGESFLAQATALAQEAASEPLPQRRAILLAAADRLATLAGREMTSEAHSPR